MLRILMASSVMIGAAMVGPAMAAPAPGNPAGVPVTAGNAPALPVTPNISVVPQVGSQGGQPNIQGGGFIVSVPAGSTVTVGFGATTGTGGTNGGVGVTISTP